MSRHRLGTAVRVIVLCVLMSPLVIPLLGGCSPAELSSGSATDTPRDADENAGGGATNDAAGDAANPPLEEDPDPTNLGREIEEADIIKQVDGLFYLSNPYKGLRIINGRDMDRPGLMGTVALGGRGVELYVVEGFAYVLTSADFYLCAGDPVGFGAPEVTGVTQPDYTGSRLWIVDVSDPNAPVVVSHLDFDGFVAATRRVDSVLYVAGSEVDAASTQPAPQEDSGGGDTRSTDGWWWERRKTGVFVDSISIADPAAPTLVKSLDFRGASLDIHVSDTAMYVLGPDDSVPDTTIVSYVDIRDPGGEVRLRDQFRVPGVVANRFFADESGTAFRIVTQAFLSGSVATEVSLYVYDVTNPDDITRLAKLPIVQNESLRAVRFDGPRGYAVTFEQVDPLFVLDLSDAGNPKLAGQLEVPGFSTFLFPRGERLIGVGFDDTDGFRPAVSLYDVSNPGSPAQLSRVVVGQAGRFGTSEATVDEKAIKILQNSGVILLPFSGFRAADGDKPTDYYFAGVPFDSLQIIGWQNDALTVRGSIDHAGLVRRAGALDGRLWILSDLSFQTVDASNLDAPKPLGKLALVDEQELLDTGLINCVETARSRGREVAFFGMPFNDFTSFDVCSPMAVGVMGVGLAGAALGRRRGRGGSAV